MKRESRSGRPILLAAIAIAGIAVTWAVGQARENDAARQDAHEVARIMGKTVPMCIGRFLINMPEEALVELREQRIDGIKIVSFDEAPADFQARLARREGYLKSAPDRLGGNKNLESVRTVNTANGVAGKIFVHGRTVTEGTQARGLELERYRYEGVAIEALVHADGMTFEFDAADYNPDLIENLPRLVEKLVPNRSNRPPTESGFCIYRAWFRDPLTADQNEQVLMFAQLPSHPDVDFRLSLLAGARPAEQGLLQRSAESYAQRSAAQRMRISRLRAARRTIGGLVGDEVIDRFHEFNDTILYSFWWEVNGTADNVLVPHVTLTMDTGEGPNNPASSSLSQGAAMSLWDNVSSSIRFWPTPSPEHNVGEAPPAPSSADRDGADKKIVSPPAREA